MDLRETKAVVAVAEEGGFSVAARRPHVVRSAASSTVRALERELDAALFRRTTHRVSLTPAGRAFLPAARAALHAAEEARAAVGLTQGELRGEITIGVVQGLYAGLAAAPADFHRERPSVVVRLRQAPAGDIPQALRDGIVDLAVAALHTPVPRGLATRLLSREETVLVTAPTPNVLPSEGPGTGVHPLISVALPSCRRLPCPAGAGDSRPRTRSRHGRCEHRAPPKPTTPHRLPRTSSSGGVMRQPLLYGVVGGTY